MKIHSVSEPDDCGKLWEVFNEGRSIWDEWGVRKALIDAYKYELKFVVADDGPDRGVLPLWFNKRLDAWEWVSDEWAEDNYPFCDRKLTVSRMIESAGKEVCLGGIKADKVHLFDQSGIVSDHEHFGVSMDGRSTDEILDHLIRRKDNVRRNIRKIEKLNPGVFYNRNEDLEKLFALNVVRMHDKSEQFADEDESVFDVFPENRRFIENLVENSKMGGYECRLVSVEIGNEVAAVDLNLVWKNQYYQLTNGRNVAKFGGLGAYCNRLAIDDAARYQSVYVDYCMENHHWKSDWFEPDPRYKYMSVRSHEGGSN